VSAEVGELAEVVQWKSDQEATEYLKTSEGKSKLSEEVADVAIYLLRICQQQNLNFIDILNKKMELNSLNYPIEKSKGSARKYTELNR
jgi:dCTP diphosphatase